MRKHGLTPALALCGALLLATAGTGMAQSYYAVKANATGLNTGATWADAFTQLESALAVAQAGDEIWVAAGTYTPSNDHGLGIGDRGKHFEMKAGVAIYGGFRGVELTRARRNPAANVVVLSGDIGLSGNSSDNCYHVFYHPDGLALDATAILDGVTISGGNASSEASPHNCGGGMYNNGSSPALTDCIFSDNAADSLGGGMYNNSASPTLTQCVFDGNSSDTHGAGMYNSSSSSPTLTNCRLIGNEAALNGGAMYNASSSPTLTSCTLTGNGASLNGGAMHNASSSPHLTNCTLNGNSAGVAGGALANDTSSSPVLKNCLLWGDDAASDPEVRNSGSGNPKFRACDAAGSGGSAAWVASFGTNDGGNIDADPLFVDAGGGNWRLQAGSPCIDAGDGNAAPPRDKDGNARVDDPDVANTGMGSPAYTDIGAYERQVMAVTFPSNSGISLERGKSYNITWTSSLPKGSQVTVELVKGTGESWQLSPGVSGKRLKWTVGKWKSKTEPGYDDNADDYRIRISAAGDSYGDESDSDFAIGSVISLTVTGPTDVFSSDRSAQFNCTATYDFGTDRDVTKEVKWSCTRIKGVKIGKGGALKMKTPLLDQPCVITAAYGKGKTPVSTTYDIQIHP